MRAEPHEPKRILASFQIDQHEVWPDVAITVIGPIASQCVIAILRIKRGIGREQF